MKELKFNKSDVPQLLLDVKCENEIIDIHNDFLCFAIRVENDSLMVYLEKNQPEKNFKPQTKFEYGCIEFKQFEVKDVEKILSEKLPSTITNLSIGEIHFPDAEKNKKTLFVISFVNSELDDYEIVSSELVIKFWNETK